MPLNSISLAVAGTVYTAARRNAEVRDNINDIESSGRLFTSRTTVAFGGAVAARDFFRITGSHTPASGTSAYALAIIPTINPAAGGDAAGLLVQPTLTEAGSGTHALLAGASFLAPTITAGGAAVTNAATVYIAAAPTATVTGAAYALWVDAGESRFDAAIRVANNVGVWVRNAADNAYFRAVNVDGSDVLEFGSGALTAARLTVNSAVVMAVSSGGLFTFSGFGTHSFSAGGAGGNSLRVRNTSAGTANLASIYVGNDADAVLGGLVAFSSTYTTSGSQVANGLELQFNGAGGGSISATHASGAVRVYTGGTTLRATFTSGGALQLPGISSLALHSTANVNVTGAMTVANGLTFGTSLLTVNFADGRVGIGTASPGTMFDVNGFVQVVHTTGITTFTSTASAAWIHNSTNAAGGYAEWQRSGTAKGRIGQSIGGASADEFGIYAVSNLRMRADTSIYFSIASDTPMAYMGSEYIRWRHDNVAHGMTSVVPTDVYGYSEKYASSEGGWMFAGLTEGVQAMVFDAYGTTSDSAAATTTSTGAFTFYARKKSGTSGGSYAADDNIFVVRNDGAAQFVIKGDGRLYSNDNLNTFSEFEDWKLALTYEAALSPLEQVQTLFRKYCDYNRDTLEEAGLVHWDLDGRGAFSNVVGLTKLAIGASWQLGIAHERLRGRVDDVEYRAEELDKELVALNLVVAQQAAEIARLRACAHLAN